MASAVQLIARTTIELIGLLRANSARSGSRRQLKQPTRISFSEMALNSYSSLAVLFMAALGFALAPLGLAWLWARVFSPAKPNAVKNAIYECGLESKGDAWMQFHSAYYLYAIIFLIFDVEAVFLLPFAVAFSGLTVAACGAMLVFVLLLVEGLAWAWAKGVLTWQ